MQQILITGNLGGDPEMRYTPNGKAVTNFSVADNRKFTTADGQAKEETIWFRVQCWERLAETANQYLKKGAHVLVLGELIADERGGPKIWQAQDGTARASFEVRAQRVEFLDRKPADAAPQDAPTEPPA
jgi:single-strand DNA-binding protein